MAVDSKRFDDLVGVTLTHARSFRNPYGVAYQGFEIGNSAIDSRIAAWAESDLADKVGGASSRQWAEAMVDKYGGVPSENEWRTDPIASRLSPALAESLHDNIIRLAAELVARRAKQ